MESGQVLALAALVGIVALFVYLARRSGKMPDKVSSLQETTQGSPTGKDRETGLHFANVYAMLTDERRESLIAHYRETEGVTRIRAMERACEDWEKHNRLQN